MVWFLMVVLLVVILYVLFLNLVILVFGFLVMINCICFGNFNVLIVCCKIRFINLFWIVCVLWLNLFKNYKIGCWGCCLVYWIILINVCV